MTRGAAQEILPAAKLIVTHDALIALSGATAGEPGIITIAGTGSMAFGRNAAGKTARAGGWGYVFGDEGGAFDITRQALRAALRFEEGWGPATVLRDRLLQATGRETRTMRFTAFYTRVFPPRIASFAGLVDEASAAGDDVAASILTNAAQRLSSAVGVDSPPVVERKRQCSNRLRWRRLRVKATAGTLQDAGGDGNRQSLRAARI